MLVKYHIRKKVVFIVIYSKF